MKSSKEFFTESFNEIKLGTKYIPIGKKYTCTVVDIWKTYNLAGELVKTCYVATHQFNGQEVFEYDVLETTIKRGLIH